MEDSEFPPEINSWSAVYKCVLLRNLFDSFVCKFITHFLLSALEVLFYLYLKSESALGTQFTQLSSA